MSMRSPFMNYQSESVTIELKNSTIIHGTIASVSPQIDTSLHDVKMTPKSRGAGDQPHTAGTVALDTMSVRGSTIQNHVLPDKLELQNLLIDDAPKPKNKARKET